MTKTDMGRKMKEDKRELSEPIIREKGGERQELYMCPCDAVWCRGSIVQHTAAQRAEKQWNKTVRHLADLGATLDQQEVPVDGRERTVYAVTFEGKHLRLLADLASQEAGWDRCSPR